MARLFTDGAEMGDTLFWTYNPAPGQVSANSAEAYSPGAYCYRLLRDTGGGVGVVNTPFTASTEIYARVRVKMGTSHAHKISIYNVATELLQLAFNPTLTRFDITLAATGNTGVGSVLLGTYVLVEIRYKIDGSAGVVTVKLDGNQVFTFTGNTVVSGKVDCDTLQITPSSGGLGTTGYFYVDDLAVNDTTGGSDDSWCGDGIVIAVKPNADGDSSDFTNSSGDSLNNFSYVDDIPPDGDTSYVESTTVGHKDLYNLENYVGSSRVVNRVWVEHRAKSSAGAGVTFKPLIKTGGTEYAGSDHTLTTSYARYVSPEYTVNPFTSVPWSEADVDDLQIGQEVT